MHTDNAFRLNSAEWTQLNESGVTASYKPNATHYAADARRREESMEPQKVEFPQDPIFSSPAGATEFFSHNRLTLNVGESREFNAVGFGYPSWQMVVTKIKMTRGDNRPLERAGLETITAEYFESDFDTPMGPFHVKTWSDSRGVLLRSVLTMPFGDVVTTLD